MLHPLSRVVPCLLLALLPGRAWSQDAGPVDAAPTTAVAPVDNARFSDLLSVQAQQALADRLEGRVVEVRRRLPVPEGYAVPGGMERTGAGLVLGPGRVLTASLLTAGWPSGTADIIEVGPEGARLPAALGLEEPHLGLAVLDVHGLSGAAQDLAPVRDDALWAGRPVYGVDPRGRLLRAVVVGPGTDVLAYYFKAQGDVFPPGAPVFGADGTWVSIVGRRTDDTPTTAWLLPPKAINALRERAAEWRP